MIIQFKSIFQITAYAMRAFILSAFILPHAFAVPGSGPDLSTSENATAHRGQRSEAHEVDSEGGATLRSDEADAGKRDDDKPKGKSEESPDDHGSNPQERNSTHDDIKKEIPAIIVKLDGIMKSIGAMQPPPSSSFSIAPWLAVGFSAAAVLLSLFSLIACVRIGGKIRAWQTELLAQAKLNDRQLDEMASQIRALPRNLAPFLEDLPSRTAKTSLPAASTPTSRPEAGANEDRRPPPAEFDANFAREALALVVKAAATSDPMGGNYRVRLEHLARGAGCETPAFASVLCQAYKLFSGSGHPLLSRGNFIGIMESRSPSPDVSPLVATFSEEVFEALSSALSSPKQS